MLVYSPWSLNVCARTTSVCVWEIKMGSFFGLHFKCLTSPFWRHPCALWESSYSLNRFFLSGGLGGEVHREFRGQFTLSTQHFCTLEKHKSSQSKKKKAPEEMILILSNFFLFKCEGSGLFFFKFKQINIFQRANIISLCLQHTREREKRLLDPRTTWCSFFFRCLVVGQECAICNRNWQAHNFCL